MDKNDIIAMRTTGAGLEKDGLVWSDEDKRKVEDLFHTGAGISEIALLMQRSEPAVLQQLVKEKFFQNETKSRTRTKREQSCLCPNCASYETCKQNQQQVCETLHSILYGEVREGQDDDV